jgi:hypothetical protein
MLPSFSLFHLGETLPTMRDLIPNPFLHSTHHSLTYLHVLCYLYCLLTFLH